MITLDFIAGRLTEDSEVRIITAQHEDVLKDEFITTLRNKATLEKWWGIVQETEFQWVSMPKIIFDDGKKTVVQGFIVL